MTDDINKKISIDVEINTDGQQQINQYKIAFDGLRNTIDNLGKPLNDLSSTLNTLNKDISKIGDSSGESKNKIADIASSFALWNNAIELLRKSFSLMNASISAGLSILITFAPEILKWISSLFNSKEAIDKAKLSLDALNKGISSTDYANAVQKMDQLKIKVDLAKKSIIDKSSVVKEYNDTLGKSIGKVKSLDQVETMLKNNAPAYIKAMAYKAAAIVAINEAAEKQIEAQKELIKSDAESIDYMNSGLANSDDPGIKKLYADIAKRNREAAAKPLQDSADALLKIAEDYEIKETKTLDLITANSPVGKLKKQIDDLKKIGDADVIGSKTFKRIKELQKEIKELNAPPDSSYTYKPHKNAVSQPAQPTPSSTFQSPNTPAADPVMDSDDQAALNTRVISDAQKASDALKQIESDRLHDMMIKGDTDRAEKLEKEKLYAQQLKDFEINTAQQVSSAAFSILENGIKQQAEAKISALESQKDAELNNSSLTGAQRIAIEAKFKKQEDQVKRKAFKEGQEASVAQAVINGALAITKATSQTGVLSPFVVPEIIAETAIEIAKIESQKPPAYASGGLHYQSDGRGGVLSGYSRTDNTNAWLRSGEGIVVSEAMRAPWARNLVSAINVGFGGRDFSTSHTGRGYAVGGVFTDGGDANRYYNAPVNDQKNLANTIAYQMINNFPPVYVDVKDINNQQNILAQTINRVNL